MMHRLLRARSAACLLALACGPWVLPAHAWGDAGHRISAAIAYARLTPAARSAVDTLLENDADTLTAPDFASRATWADRFRDSDRDSGRARYLGTRLWHFVNIQLDDADLDAPCRGHPPLPSGTPASAGPADACVIDKVVQFAAELQDRALPPAERLVALKFLIHFVGDLHQPLHAADRHDAGGNLTAVRDASAPGDITNLHAYWDVRLVEALGRGPPPQTARVLNRRIGAAQARAWSAGQPADWAREAWLKAKTAAYDLRSQRSQTGADGKTIVVLDAAYRKRSLPVAGEQLAKAGVRLAALLNAAFP
jgi:hypothetical protein